MEPSVTASGDLVPPPLTDPSLPTSGNPVLPPSVDAIKSMGEMYKKIDPKLIDALVSFIKTQIHKMNTQSEAVPNSSQGSLATVGDAMKFAAFLIDTISKETEKLSKSYGVKELGSVTLEVMKGVEEMQVFIGLAVAAFAVESYMNLGSAKNECRELLLKILQLAKDVKQYDEEMAAERGKVCNAIVTIVEGVFICLGYLKGENFLRFWSVTTAAAQLEKTNRQLRDVTDFLDQSSHGLFGFEGDVDVFLSHSGTQKNFVRQLHVDLKRENVSCFFDEDDDSLPLAEDFPSRIFEAAKTCKIAVSVLSKEFIHSKWPMLELSAFIRARNSGKNANPKLLPIFFMISPEELSRITKDSPEWQKLKNVSNETREEWQEALKEVRRIIGMKFHEGGNEVSFRDQVVKKIICILKRTNPETLLQLLDFKPVGIEEKVEEVRTLMDMQGDQSALAVIVCGFGGIGKTTLAKNVVQSLDLSSSDFKFCWVAIDEQAPNKTSHIIDLQKHIIYALGGVKFDFQNPDEGRVQIKEALKNKCSLLFIDNVVHIDYIRDLLPKDLWSGEKNTKLRILITSREITVKAELRIKCKEYGVKCLSDAASKRLLFETIMPSEVEKDIGLDERRMINEVATACRGVPLLLSVFGNHLRVARDEDSYQKDKDSYPKESYEDALVKLREGNLASYQDEDISKTLMFVFDKIKEVEVQEVFLDICKYFHGWKWNLVADIVDISKLEDLRRRMLVSKSGSDEVIVHDILRLMGMNKAKFTRFSNYNELSDALENNLDGFGNVKGISLVNDDRLITIQSTKLNAMHQSLRVLMLGDWVTLDGSPLDKAFKNLRYLSVGAIAVFPFKDLSTQTKLRVFLNRSEPGMNLCHLPSSLKRISHEVRDVECHKFVELPFQYFSELKSFTVITGKSVELPKEVHLPASLVDLHLKGCKKFPKDIGHLTALESLILDGSDLELLPQGFGKLKKLKRLSMNGCSKLSFLSEELGMLSSLEVLSIDGCGRNWRALPESFGGLSSLRALSLGECINLTQLPESFGELRIHSLELYSLGMLHDLPSSLGNMPLLKDLKLESCGSLMSLPNSFVKLKMLDTLHISWCAKLGVLPKDFGRLRCLKHMTVKECHLLKELPHGFGALPALKTFRLKRCTSLVNLPRDFVELTCLEELHLKMLPSISRIPEGFGKLKKLRFLSLDRCSRLKTLPDDFENLATLERLSIRDCPELEGAMMEKILKLPNCYKADISGSIKLSEKWEHMQGETEHPIVVDTGCGEHQREREAERAMKAALLHGKYVEVNNGTDQLVERLSLLVGLEQGVSATVALIMLPIRIDSRDRRTLHQFVETARETVKANGSGELQIVCARKLGVQTPTEKEERQTPMEEEEVIPQILLSLPKGSCAIPPTEYKRVKILTGCCELYGSKGYLLSFLMANVVDVEGCKRFENLKYIPEHEMYETSREPKNSIGNFIQKLEKARGQSESESGSFAGELMEALKGEGIEYLLNDCNRSKVAVDDLHGKAIGIFIGDLKFLDCVKLQQIYKDLQQKDSNFIAIWIPILMVRDGISGHGSYTRLIQCMPWATFPRPPPPHLPLPLLFYDSRPRFVLLDEHGQIATRHALALLLGWGVKLYPFTQRTIRESLFLTESESCLEFLLQGMNIVGRKPMKSKITFLYAVRPDNVHMKRQLEEITQIHGNFEVLYVGNLFLHRHVLSNDKQIYEDARQDMRWPSLSFSDMIMFWFRCQYLESVEGDDLIKESNILMDAVRGLAHQLMDPMISLVVVDKDGAVTRGGYEVVQMICESADEMSEGERMVKEELSRGECGPLAKTFFADEIHNHLLHPQHPIHPIQSKHRPFRICGVCLESITYCFVNQSYGCYVYRWDMCRRCGTAYAKRYSTL